MERRVSIRPIQGRLTHDCDTFSKMDPYCIFQIGSEKKKSSVHNSGGLNPVWRDTIFMSIGPNDSVLHLTVMDKDTFKRDDLVGSTKISLDRLF